MKVKHDKRKRIEYQTYEELISLVDKFDEEKLLESYSKEIMKKDEQKSLKEIIKDSILRGYMAGRKEVEEELNSIEISFSDFNDMDWQ